jgi:3-methyladenine DNA glycosylase AlkD
MSANRALIAEVRKGLAAAADPARAVGQQAYMKSVMPYYGVTSAELHRISRAVFAEQLACERQGPDRPDLLYACIEPNLADRDFFIRKAIGWSLRAYAWVDPREIGRYVQANQARLSGLSRREALKNIGSSLE